MLTLHLSPELERNLLEEARRRGAALESLAIDALQQAYGSAVPTDVAGETTLAVAWADYIGSINSKETALSDGHLSEDTGKKFAESLCLTPPAEAGWNR